MIVPLRKTDLLPDTLQNLFYPPTSYTYFDRMNQFSFPTAGRLQRAAVAADAAMLAYARYGAVRMNDNQLKANFDRAGLRYQTIGEDPTNWNAPGTQAVFAYCDDFAICAFRGTEIDDHEDSASDLDAELVREPPQKLSGLAFLHAGLVSLFPGHSLVHEGFQHALDRVWDQITHHVAGYRAQHPGKEICFTGHSLGAALALLAFSRSTDPDRSVFTFGCPRVGNSTFRDRVLANPGLGVHRFVNYNDVVAHVPIDSRGYCQIPETCYRFLEYGDLDTDDGSFKGDLASLTAAILSIPASLASTGRGLMSTSAPASLVDHSPARYCFRLWDCV